jgi:carboxyl-terminal processing protease
VIVDLRGNSGGSLFEANKLVGLFIASGVTLQVKSNNGFIRPWGDRQAKQIWKKPMAVLVDRYSASASEIFAGAIQDYQRGLVLGHRTYGKGTVQKLANLSSGQLKLTESRPLYCVARGKAFAEPGASRGLFFPWRTITKIGAEFLAFPLDAGAKPAPIHTPPGSPTP